MCGVFAYAATNNTPVNPEILERIARATEQRGQHAWGVAWIDKRGRLSCYKAPGAIGSQLDVLATLTRDAVLLIGHCRWATAGSPLNNLNNHPHPCDGGWIVHNGIVPNHRGLIRDLDLYPVTDCDSEVLALVAEQASGSLLDRCTEAVLTVPRSPLVLLGLWKPGILVAVRQGNPLHMAQTRAGYYLASLAEGMPGRPREVDDDSAFELGVEGATYASL